MCIRFNNTKIINENNSGSKVTLKPLSFMRANNSGNGDSGHGLRGLSIPDSYKGITKKDSTFHLISPFELFSLHSSKPSIINKTQTLSTSQSGIQWGKQFNDPAVAGGNAPAGYTSAGNNISMSLLSKAAKEILSKGQPLGTCTPVIIDGQKLLAVDQTHYWTMRNGEKVNVPGGLHGVSIYIKK
jgi:hypothetical protein